MKKKWDWKQAWQRNKSNLIWKQGEEKNNEGFWLRLSYVKKKKRGERSTKNKNARIPCPNFSSHFPPPSHYHSAREKDLGIIMNFSAKTDDHFRGDGGGGGTSPVGDGGGSTMSPVPRTRVDPSEFSTLIGICLWGENRMVKDQS